MAYRSGFSNPFGFSVTPLVKRLVIANCVVFLLTLGIPQAVAYLQFDPGLIFPRFWTPFTYMFVHGGFFHLLFNMLMLFFFGPPLEERWGSREFLKYYVIAGLGGAVLSILSPYPIIGASAAVYGILVAFAVYWPDNPIYVWGIFPVKAKWLVAFLVGISFFSAFSAGSTGIIAHLAHLGGALAGFVYLKSSLAPPAWGERPARQRSSRWEDRFKRVFRSQRPQQAERQDRPVTPVRKRPQPRSADDVDQILEKISKGGLQSLTAEERLRLEEASRKYKAN